MLEYFEPVAICNQFSLFLFCQLKPKRKWKPFVVTISLLINSFRFVSIEFCQVSVQHDLDPSNSENSGFQGILWRVVAFYDRFHRLSIILLCHNELDSFLQSLCWIHLEIQSGPLFHQPGGQHPGTHRPVLARSKHQYEYLGYEEYGPWLIHHQA